MTFGVALQEIDRDRYEALCLIFRERYASTRNSHTGEFHATEEAPQIRLGDRVVQVNLAAHSMSYDWDGDLGELEVIVTDAAQSAAESDQP